MAKNEIAKTEELKDESQLPAYLQGQDYKPDDDGFGMDDVAVPQIKLLQGISPEVQEHENARPGEWWHTGLDIPLGSEFKFIIADRRRKVLLSAPLADGQGILARADDGKTWDKTGEWQVKIKGLKQPVTWKIEDLSVEKSGLMKFGTSNPTDEDSPPAATLFYDYLVYLPDFPDLGMAVLSLSRSKIRKAKKGLNDKIKMQGDAGRPLQALIFKARTIEDHGDEGPYSNVSFMSAGFVQDKDLFDRMSEYKGALANMRIKDEVQAEDEKPDADDGEGNF